MKMTRSLCGWLLLALSAAAQAQSQKMQDQTDDGQWTMPAKNYASTRFSTLTDINTETVKNLKLAWTFSTGLTRGHEAAPLVVNSTMYIVTPWPNILYALDLTKPGAPVKTAWWVHAAALWLWHIPRFFQATLDNDWVHSAQHVSFLGSALLFWWSLFYAHGKARYGASVLYLFTTAVHTSILGALLTFDSTVWYPVYVATTAAWGLTPLEDQQAGGLIMWIPAGLVYVIGALALLALWLRESDRIANTRPFERKGEYAA